jgi:uncharacterized protein with ParB-like and HNH nuclease domain
MIPPKVNLGQHYNLQLCSLFYNNKEYGHLPNTILGYKIPYFQRPLVWTQEQKIKLIESLWCGIPIGTFTINENSKNKELDNILIDGQQRINTISEYINDRFPVYGVLYSEVSDLHGRFNVCSFPQYVTNSEDIEYLKNYYNLMNFGGTAHKEGERA